MLSGKPIYYNKITNSNTLIFYCEIIWMKICLKLYLSHRTKSKCVGLLKVGNCSVDRKASRSSNTLSANTMVPKCVQYSFYVFVMRMSCCHPLSQLYQPQTFWFCRNWFQCCLPAHRLSYLTLGSQGYLHVWSTSTIRAWCLWRDRKSVV